MEKAQQLIREANLDVIAAGGKGSVGIVGAFAAMSINDWAGLFVAVLTGVYMGFQIEAAWRKRRIAILRENEIFNELKREYDVQKTKEDS